ncbi:MAG: hypothetical protein A2202_06595 [Bdellovibrionales bacterium RIFOXYA1_FULL_36_14]|nr:MAG: hypothetical protein A2202_06595 [Bdellovibrionales bacterium RIFOXYA1_FULL_36_14]
MKRLILAFLVLSFFSFNLNAGVADSENTKLVKCQATKDGSRMAGEPKVKELNEPPVVKTQNDKASSVKGI